MKKEIQEKLLKLVRDGYDEIAEDFSVTREKKLWPEIVKLASQVKDGDAVLDVGCGNGRLFDALKDKEIYYLGIDGSAKLIEIAKNNYQLPITNPPACLPDRLAGRAGFQTIPNSQYPIPNKILNPKFQILNIIDLNKLDEKNFNYIFSIAVLHHLPGEDLRIDALRQMKNKLAEDGKIIISVWNLWSQIKYLKLIIKFAWQKIIGRNKMDFGDIIFDWKNSKGEKISQRYYHAFTKRELKRLSKKTGLKVKKLYKDKFNFYLVLTKA
jgi:SAM-dependent methyltransferase